MERNMRVWTGSNASGCSPPEESLDSGITGSTRIFPPRDGSGPENMFTDL
jgi:hypothetical protein